MVRLAVVLLRSLRSALRSHADQTPSTSHGAFGVFVRQPGHGGSERLRRSAETTTSDGEIRFGTSASGPALVVAGRSRLRAHAAHNLSRASRSGGTILMSGGIPDGCMELQFEWTVGTKSMERRRGDDGGTATSELSSVRSMKVQHRAQTHGLA